MSHFEINSKNDLNKFSDKGLPTNESLSRRLTHQGFLKNYKITLEQINEMIFRLAKSFQNQLINTCEIKSRMKSKKTEDRLQDGISVTEEIILSIILVYKK